jgi:transcriptional regulator with XRE-family HTH domain
MENVDGRKLKDRRVAARIAQQDLARAANISVWRLSRFERGKSARLTPEECQRLMASFALLLAEREVGMTKAIT